MANILRSSDDFGFEIACLGAVRARFPGSRSTSGGDTASVPGEIYTEMDGEASPAQVIKNIDLDGPRPYRFDERRIRTLGVSSPTVPSHYRLRREFARSLTISQWYLGSMGRSTSTRPCWPMVSQSTERSVFRASSIPDARPDQTSAGKLLRWPFEECQHERAVIRARPIRPIVKDGQSRTCPRACQSSALRGDQQLAVPSGTGTEVPDPTLAELFEIQDCLPERLDRRASIDRQIRFEGYILGIR